MRRNSDASIRRLERAYMASGSTDDLLRFGRQLALQDWEFTTAPLAVVQRLIQAALPGTPDDTVNAQVVCQSVAWVMSDDIPGNRPWSWRSLEAGLGEKACALAVQLRNGEIVFGVNGIDSMSRVVRLRAQRLARDTTARLDRGEDEKQVRGHEENMRRVGPTVTPDVCWPELEDDETEHEDSSPWHYEIQNAYDHLEMNDALAAWAASTAHDRVRMSVRQARVLLTNVFGFDRSNYEQVLGAIDRAEPVPVRPTRLGVTRMSPWALLEGVRPPVQEIVLQDDSLLRIQPINAAGPGWVLWTLQVLQDSLDARPIGRGDVLRATVGDIITDIGPTTIRDRERYRSRIRFLEQSPDYQGGNLADEDIIIWIRGSVIERERAGWRSLWERLSGKAIQVTHWRPVDMGTARYADREVGPEGFFRIGLPYAHMPYDAEARDIAPYGLQYIAEEVLEVMRHLFPDIPTEERWEW